MEELKRLRVLAVARSLSEAGTLQGAVDRLGFVQADPIRSPARAQDLILRHRVAGYRAGDLERLYPRLDMEEDYLYAYGFVSRGVWRLLHPRGSGAPGAFEKKVLAGVAGQGEAHPSALEVRLGARRVTNAWGGLSKATTQALDWLHYRGLLRIARREGGVRVFAPAHPAPEPLPPRLRMRERVLALVNILAPVPLRRYFPGMGTAAAFLAPFDPLVWDRGRFKQFWGWEYRFEAYTPAARRVRGYYAMPLLWGDSVVGWANATVSEGLLHVQTGFAGARPSGAAFRRELEAEKARLAVFLGARL